MYLEEATLYPYNTHIIVWYLNKVGGKLKKYAAYL